MAYLFGSPVPWPQVSWNPGMNGSGCKSLNGVRFFLSFLATALVLEGGVALAQEAVSSPASGNAGLCSPVRSKQYEGLAPSLPATAGSPETIRKLTAAYRQVALSTDLKMAHAALEQLRADASTDGATCVEALALYGLAAETRSENPQVSIGYLNQADGLFENLHSLQGVAMVQLRLGAMYKAQKRFDDALQSYSKAEELFKRDGNTEEVLRTRLSAQEAQREPQYEPLALQAEASHLPCVQADVEEAWAYRLWRSDKLADAKEHYQLSDTLYAQCPHRKAARAALQTAMGRMERQQGRPRVALQHYRLALSLQIQSGDTSLVPQTYNAMGVAYEALGDAPSAFARYKQGISYAKRLHSQVFVEFIEANLATAYTRDHQPRPALPLLLKLSENVAGNHLRCLRLGQLSSAYSHLLQDERAIAISQKSQEACRAEGENERIVQNDSTTTDSELRLHLYTDALRDAQEGLSILEDERAHLVATDAHKQGFTSTSLVRGLYSNAIAALTALHRGGEAFELAEQARARAFLDLLASHQGTPATAISSRSMEQYRKDLIDSPAHVTPMTTAAMLTETSRLHSTLLAYWVAQDCLYIWIAREGMPVLEFRQPVSEDRISRLVLQTHSPALLRGAPSSAWRDLYRLLIAPVEAQLPREEGALLTVVPGGPLFSLSFAALKNRDGRYLVERFRIHTTPSISLLSYTHRNDESNRERAAHYLLLSNPQQLPLGGDARQLPSLPGTALETDAIARSLPPDAVTRLSSRDANVTALTGALPQATTVHFATHAVLNDADPYSSFLALDDTNHDGRLTVAQIYALPIHSRLVVLSACNTGLGKITGDGVAGMSRAFFYAGAASVMTTMWNIADQPTAELQPRFYAALAEGQSPSKALRTAQLFMLRDLRRHRVTVETLSGGRESLPENPIYWASFSLSGQP